MEFSEFLNFLFQTKETFMVTSLLFEKVVSRGIVSCVVIVKNNIK